MRISICLFVEFHNKRLYLGEKTKLFLFLMFTLIVYILWLNEWVFAFVSFQIASITCLLLAPTWVSKMMRSCTLFVYAQFWWVRWATGSMRKWLCVIFKTVKDYDLVSLWQIPIITKRLILSGWSMSYPKFFGLKHPNLIILHLYFLPLPLHIYFGAFCGDSILFCWWMCINCKIKILIRIIYFCGRRRAELHNGRCCSG